MYPGTIVFVINISICHINICSILCQNSDIPRFEQLHSFITKEHKFDVVGLTETHLDNTIDSDEINIDGFTVFRKDRNSSGGGVLLYIRNELMPIQMSELETSDIESVYVKIKTKKLSAVCGVCYRS